MNKLSKSDVLLACKCDINWILVILIEYWIQDAVA